MQGLVYNKHQILMEVPYLSVPGLREFNYGKYSSAGQAISEHCHTSCMEIVFVTKGTQIYRTNQQSYPLKSGQAFIALPGEPHQSVDNFHSVGEMYWLMLDLTYHENFLGFNREMSNTTVQYLSSLKQHVVNFNSTIAKLLPSVFQEFHKKGNTHIAVSSLMYLIYQFIDCAQNESIPQASTELLDQFITEHIQDNITIRDLCNLYHVSESTMQHQFKALFGRPPAEYIAYRKIKKAQEFLLSGKSVTETAMLLGYNSSSYFSTVFKKFTNNSPTEWANHHLGKPIQKNKT